MILAIKKGCVNLAEKYNKVVIAKHIHIEKNSDGIVTKQYLFHKEYFWEVPMELLDEKIKKGDIVKVLVDKPNSNNLKTHKAKVFVIDVIDNFENKEKLKLKPIIKISDTSKDKKLKKILQEKYFSEKKDKPIASEVTELAKKCFLSKKSIQSLITKYGLKKVVQAVEMMLATEDRKAPLKFLKLILENIK